MSATTQVKTFSDLYTDLQNRVRVQTGITATENQAKRYINIALQDMHVGYSERFPWAERSGQLLTQPRYNTGTVTITKGSTTLTGASTLWDTANSFGVDNMRPGGKVVISGRNEVYEVSSVTSDTVAVLTSRWVGDDVSATTYYYFEDEYTLPSDFLRPLTKEQFSDGIEIRLIGRGDFRRMFPRNSVVGRPTYACIVDRAPSGSVTLVRAARFHRPPDTAMLIPYSYITANLVVTSAGATATEFSSDADEPVIPIRYRHTLVFHALYNWYRDKKDDVRSSEAHGEYTDLMVRVASDNEVGTQRARIKPAMTAMRRRAHAPYRGGSRRYDVNSKFDYMDD